MQASLAWHEVTLEGPGFPAPVVAFQEGGGSEHTPVWLLLPASGLAPCGSHTLRLLCGKGLFTRAVSRLPRGHALALGASGGFWPASWACPELLGSRRVSWELWEVTILSIHLASLPLLNLQLHPSPPCSLAESCTIL